MRYIYIFILTLFILSCSSGSSSKKDETQTGTDTDTVVMTDTDIITIDADVYAPEADVFVSDPDRVNDIDTVPEEPDEATDALVDDSTVTDDNDSVSWKAITAGEAHTCAIKEPGGMLYCWGKNDAGQLGDSTTKNRLSPVKIGSEAWIDVAAGQKFTCGIKSADSKLYCWGDNRYGQLGNGAGGAGNYKNTPTKTGDDAWTAITAGGNHACGTIANAGLYCWGYNYNGQIGDSTAGTGYDKSVPVKISDAAWSLIAGGGSHTCAIKTDSRLYCWGYNFYGELGLGTDGASCSSPYTCADKNIPVKAGDDAWLKISAGDNFTCGIKSDNRLFCWGNNQYGQLGIGTAGIECPDYSFNCADKNTPAKIGADSWIKISAAVSHTCAVKTDGKLFCWGFNYNGQLGDGTTGAGTYKTIPAKTGDEAWSEITAGGSHTCGIRNDGRLFCWGSNSSGQLGDSTTADKNIPTPVMQP